MQTKFAFDRGKRFSRQMVVAVLLIWLMAEIAPFAPNVAFAAESAGASVAVEGKVKHPGKFDLGALRKLPAETEQVSFQSEHGVTPASFTGARLWAVLEAAGGIDDDAKGAVLRHMIRVTARDGYVVLLSTGEIAPEFGDKAALLGYQRDGKPIADGGIRLVIPGDKRGGRNVRDVATIQVE